LKPHLIGLMAATLAALPALGFAQVKQLGPNATSQDFIDSLTPGPEAPALKFRGLRVLNANPTDQATEASGPAVAVDIKFALNSAELTDQAKATLKQMAAAIKSDQLASYHFLLEGHTDTTGNPDHNLALSKRRAEAVRSYLTDQFGIDSSRLQAVGRGEDALLDPDHPTSPVNRRVQLVNTGQ
jgi:outer membrane protein OmpA-like peptidoglycan-associated protein